MKSTKLIKVVHFGDKLQKHRKMKSVIETMEPYFSEIVSIKTYSDEEKPLFRAIDFLVGFFNKGIFADYIIIDVYSTFNFYFLPAALPAFLLTSSPK